MLLTMKKQLFSCGYLHTRNAMENYNYPNSTVHKNLYILYIPGLPARQEFETQSSSIFHNENLHVQASKVTSHILKRSTLVQWSASV